MSELPVSVGGRRRLARSRDAVQRALGDQLDSPLERCSLADGGASLGSTRGECGDIRRNLLRSLPVWAVAGVLVDREARSR